MGALLQDRLADGTVGRNITLTLTSIDGWQLRAVLQGTPTRDVAIVEPRVQLWSVNQWTTEAEESPSLIFVTRKLLVKTLQRNIHCGELIPRKN
jgi:hypothetical protein